MWAIFGTLIIIKEINILIKYIVLALMWNLGITIYLSK